MSTGYKISEPEGLYYLTLQIVGADEESILDVTKIDFLWKTIK